MNTKQNIGYAAYTLNQKLKDEPYFSMIGISNQNGAPYLIVYTKVKPPEENIIPTM